MRALLVVVALLIVLDAVLGYLSLSYCLPHDLYPREVEDCARAAHRARTFAVAFRWSVFVTAIAVAYAGVSLRRRRHDAPADKHAG